MARSETTRHPFAPLLMLASALALLVASVTPGLHPASADQFTPLEDPPSITIVADAIYTGADAGLDPDVGGAFTALGAGDRIVPASPRSTTVYNIFAQLATNGDLANVTEIRLCLYDSADAAFVAEGVADETAIAAQCGIPASLAAGAGLPDAPTGEGQAWAGSGPDPKRVFVMRWLEDQYSTVEGSVDTGFRVVGTNNYADAASLFTPSGQAATARFSFKVSNAMQVSTTWRVRIAAESQAEIDTVDQTKQSARDIAGPFEVGYFATMTTPRTATNFGIAAAGVTVFRTESVVVGGSGTGIVTGQFTANDASALTIMANAFTRGEAPNIESIQLDTSGDIWDGNPARSEGSTLGAMVAAMTNVVEDRVSLDCAFIPSMMFSSGVPSEESELAKFVQVQTSARVFALPGSDLGVPRQTGETAETLDKHSCMLNYEGGAPTANVAYSNTVTVAPIQATVDVALGD